MRILWSEWIKTKRTPIRWLVFLMPVIFSGFIIWYYSNLTIKADVQISIFQTFFEIWSVLIIPLGAGLISGLMIHQEELAGSFNGLLGAKLQRRDLYLGKLAIIILCVSVSTLIAVVTLGVGLVFILNISITWWIFIVSAIMLIIGMLPLLAFHLWISFAWGMGASIGIGGGGMLIAALMVTSLGDKVWKFVPWAWPVRLSILPGAYLLYKLGMKYPPELVSSGYIINQILEGLIPTLTLFIVMLICGIIWFKKWEGRKVYE
ncbi:lantibiotic immunity ABC transporter MutG family permease subunit [Crassaminicella indica]|uniref:Lantibiotic immunity ABC transporter MutG family permease subunit n=1 Tax=Crassaminicella indica TaxID=2855394 RepID=A0ABX8R8T4_9CLOT|nr:lantibiotic immunity ABC transporter MutG family permease subunit [Crassaminicella indica]QXM05468.1 lantibiotic immunity ABC transporter MutG family permease subunit [Crassaminicella indica]